MNRSRLRVLGVVCAVVLLPVRAAAQGPPAATRVIGAPAAEAAARGDQLRLSLKALIRREAVRLAGAETRRRKENPSDAQVPFSLKCYSPGKRIIAGAVIGAVAGGALAAYLSHRTGFSLSSREFLQFAGVGSGAGAAIGFASC